MPRTSAPLPLAPGLAGLEPYRVPRHAAPADLRLDGNEGAWVPRELLELPPAPETVRGYPSAPELEALLADRFGVAVERVVLTAGADDALARAVRVVGAPGRNAILPVPTFEMLARYLRLSPLEIREIPWTEPAWPCDAVLDAIDDSTAAVAIVSPNNPTGGHATAGDLERVLARAPRALAIVDQAYVEYSDHDLAAVALAAPNAVLIRTLSKAWGLAGLRVGYAIVPRGLEAAFRAVGQPYPVAGPSIARALAVLRSQDGWMRAHVARVRDERVRLERCLRSLGQRPNDSQANFVCVEAKDAAWLADGLAGLGIAVRRFAGTPGLEGALRITCPGDAAAYDRLDRGLRAALAPEALLLDMDGVLADVSGSYRETIVGTAAWYGVTLDSAEVRAAKAAGDANNDWVVTQRLLASHGVEAPFEEVRARFESLYQGDGTGPGLRDAERLIPGRAVVARLAARRPVAVVTGRPRADAERFLERFGLWDDVAALVAMEDAPPKPDPSPVRHALAALGARTAWMIGDTPDDVRAARAAGVVPIGTTAPGDGPELRDALLRAGAARVVDGLEDIEELLGRLE